jgi:glycosyltransferase involved in cell wall biosynthesis
MPTGGRPLRVLFVNAGILGLTAYHTFLQETLPKQSRLQGELILLPEQMSFVDRSLRRVLNARLWRDGWFGLANMDLVRFRAELNTGLHARRRLATADLHDVDALFFHRQSAAWGSLDLMRRIPSILSIDATQDVVMSTATRSVERATYELNARVDGAVFRAAAAIVSTSRWTADCLRARYPDLRTPVHVMPPPVLLDRFDPGWADERRARAGQGGKPRILFMGGDFPRKGGFDLLDAWRRSGLRSHASLDVVTDWPLSHVPDGVRLWRGVRRLSDTWTARWREADVFVMPTRNEAFGLVYQEAGAAGLPAVGTRHHAVPEIIEDNVTGLLVDPRDTKGLAHALETLVADAALRDRLGRAARARIEHVAHPLRHLERLADIVAASSRIRPAAALR